ncbi:fumarylacetoacetate hydrolase family protein [Eoetvoesiella caeni]|uniref:2-keto-4-pentenoate hydratase/2-oxohepta-3-ene-1,7-dioic acid hydratase in catechol pathway n=1 Tax=Eoetvoesiella caeni TaxID=645616 RepID=A0A366HAU9_9BURK|nr:fumarylacetoacetate hydrolase family protein [Eoetvoesiella caeni]MCI2809844.1 fumarylacetoacetate hydrolase family protein [Eoetvoesiella caeni]NYT56241.1 fumarylacetoacetate hydrolase family protein [Eoetvoesiella caeni]RBP38298.1 2-keto-4-pentenoate hydratase/2-oxohepta-3-ene-1,7-dioic acid hydratase in catechol pathway [Eoetvoesiella caeni]
MKLVTIDSGSTGQPGAITTSGEILHLRRAALGGTIQSWIPENVRDILEAGAEGMDVIRRIVQRVEALSSGDLAVLRNTGALSPASTRLLAPVTNPRLVVAAGLAYRSHLAEMAGTPVPPHPTAFMKSVNSLTGTGATIAIPPHASGHMDYEGELAVVFGRDCHCVCAERALDYVAGYTVANDISARDWVSDVWQATTPWDARRTWEVNIMGKQFPGFTPLGPALLTADEVPDASTLQLTTRLNGKVMQSSPVSDLIFSIPETIAYFSNWYAFRPGDVLLTGTPAGVGVGRRPPVYMTSGDVIEVEIEGIGTLHNVLQG